MIPTLPPGAKRISSGATFFYKRIFPLLWYGFVIATALFVLSVGRGSGVPVPILIMPPVIMAIVGHLVIRYFLADLVDEVWDNGSELIVIDDGHAEHVPLADILNINYLGFSNPPRATLLLRRPGRWGAKLTFSPLRNFISFRYLTDHPLIDDLIQRVDAARRGG